MAEKPLKGMEFQEKEAQNEYKAYIPEICLERIYS